MYHVYHLVDPNTGTVCYVGMTKNPKRRLAGHIAEAKSRDNTDKKRWIRSLLNIGTRPVLVVVASLPTEIEARAVESHECRTNISTVYNVHDPRKGAKDIRKETKEDECQT